MGAAADRRGSRVITREADERMPAAQARADRAATDDEIARLRADVARLEHDLRRARRCLAAERLGREALRQRLQAADRAHAFSVGILARLALPRD